jgi:CheY-like chemotaxis protein/anti-sigma regulatory factor (Ser/Thr protein kinase)
MNELFNALLDISRLDAGVLTTSIVDMPASRLLTRIEDTFAGAARKKGLTFRVVASSLWLRSDVILLERIVLNLVSNAVRYTSSGGIVVGCRRRGDLLRIDVCDSGPGIPEEQRRNIFGEFYRIQKGDSHGGLGLGLSIVERLCTLLGHPIELASAVGKGSRFSVTVSATAAQAQFSEPEVAAPIAPDVFNGKCVAVIDDEALVLDGIGGILRNWGCHVVAASSCDAALASLDGEPRPDLIISDFRLGDGQSGIVAIARLREKLGSDIPAFLISGDTAPERLREARASGHHLLHKPVRPMRLRAMVSQMLQNEVAGAA